MSTRVIVLSIFIAAIFISGVIVFAGRNDALPAAGSAQIASARIENGTQIIEISAKAGYTPQRTVARANIPTVVKVNTNGTFDCSAALTIPSLNYRQHLPPSGETRIDIPSQNEGTVIQGLCAMGMYHFTVHFE